MKHLLLVGLFTCVLALSGCNDAGKEKATVNEKASVNDNPASNTSHQDLLRINRDVMHAIETGDSATIRRHIASDAVDHGGGPNGTDLTGEALLRQLSNVHHDIDNMKMEVLQDATNGEYIFTVSRLTGTTNKPVWGMPANFKIDSKSVDVVRIENMMMKDHWTYMDPADMMKMMGSGSANKNAMNDTKPR